MWRKTKKRIDIINFRKYRKSKDLKKLKKPLETYISKELIIFKKAKDYKNT